MHKKLKDMTNAEKIDEVARFVSEFYENKKRPSRLLRSIIRHTHQKTDPYLKKTIRNLKTLESERRRALKKHRIAKEVATDNIQDAKAHWDAYKREMYSVFLNAVVNIYQ